MFEQRLWNGHPELGGYGGRMALLRQFHLCTVTDQLNSGFELYRRPMRRQPSLRQQGHLLMK